MAWFSAPPRWTSGLSPEAVLPPSHGPVETAAADGAYGLETVPAGPVGARTEVLYVAAGRWCMLAPGEAPPVLSGPVLIRGWS